MLEKLFKVNSASMLRKNLLAHSLYFSLMVRKAANFKLKTMNQWKDNLVWLIQTMSYNNFIKVISLMANMFSHFHLNLWISFLEAITRLKDTRLKLFIRLRLWFNQVQKINLQFKPQLKSWLDNLKKINKEWCLGNALQNVVVVVLIKELVE